MAYKCTSLIDICCSPFVPFQIGICKLRNVVKYVKTKESPVVWVFVPFNVYLISV